MNLERNTDGEYEIVSPMFGGGITIDAAKELVVRLDELIAEAEEPGPFEDER